MGFDREGIEVEVAGAASDLLQGSWTETHRNEWPGAGGGLPPAWTAAFDTGWFDLLVDEADGGLGLGPVVAAAVVEQVGRHLFAGPVVDTIVGTAALRTAGAEVAPSAVVVFGDAPGDGLTGRLADDRVDAAGHRAEWADVADLLVLAVEGPDGTAVVAIDPKGPGVMIERQASLDRYRSPCIVHIDGTPVVAMLASGDSGTALVRRLMALRLALTAAELLGASDRMLEMSIEYARERHQFGVPIASFQAVRHHLAHMAVGVESVRSACYLAQLALRDDDADLDDLRAAMVAKAHASATARDIAERSLQVHGGVGFTAEHLLSGYFVRVLSLEAAIQDDHRLRRRLGTMALAGASHEEENYA